MSNKQIATHEYVDLKISEMPGQAETDPVFSASPAAGLTAQDMTDIANLSGTNTGDQDLSGLVATADLPTAVPANETDPVFSASPAAGITATDATRIAALGSKRVVIDGDLRGLYAVVNYKKIPYTDLGAGITITNVIVRCSAADPVTELNANIMYCDAHTTGAFPSTNPVLVAAIDTTAGNYDSGVVALSVPTGKELYLLMDADPVDLNQTWTITINYTVL